MAEGSFEIITALSNNMRNLKFKSTPTVAFFAAEVSENGEIEFNRVKRSHFLL